MNHAPQCRHTFSAKLLEMCILRTVDSAAFMSSLTRSNLTQIIAWKTIFTRHTADSRGHVPKWWC